MNETQLKLIQELAQKLGTTTDLLWVILIRQAYIQGVKDVVIFTAWAACTIVLFCVFRKIKNNNPNYEDIVVHPASVIIYFIFTIFSISRIFEAANCFFNPEFWAITEITNTIF